MQISMTEAVSLLEYSATNPTGVFAGKKWRRHNGVHDMNFVQRGGIPRWCICTYEEIPGNTTHVKNGTYRPVIRVKAPTRMYNGDWIPDDAIPGDIIVGNRGAAGKVIQPKSQFGGLCAALNVEYIGNYNDGFIKPDPGCKMYDFR